MAKNKKGRQSAANGKTAPKKTKKIDLLIDIIFSVLPATTQEEILEKVAKRWKGAPLDLGDISNALGHLRRNAVKYGWTVPYVGGAPTDKGRYFIAEVNPDGSRKKCSPQNVQHLRRGYERTKKTVARYDNNEGVALGILAPTLPAHLQSAAKREAHRMIGFSKDQMKMLADFSAKLDA